MRLSPRLLGLALAAVLAPCIPRAHEVLQQIERNRAVAVRAYFADGEALAYAEYEVYSPADPSVPYQKGRTDREGWLAFVPTAAGAWRVKIVDATGHGLQVSVDAAPSSEAASASAGDAPGSTAAFVLRPLAGVAAIIAVFGLLRTVNRRRGAAP